MWPVRYVGCAFIIAMGVSSFSTSAAPQVFRTELHAFVSLTLSDRSFLTGVNDGKPVTLSGELRIPKPGNEKLPAAILLHGSGGIGGTGTPIPEWSQELNKIGIATFTVDSFTGRGITSAVMDQDVLGRLNQIIDAYRALDFLSKHPRIDPDRVALVGTSRGGQSALYASMKRFQRLHGRPEARQFAAYLAFAPNSGVTYRGDADVSSRPLRVLHGAPDDWNPVEPCRALFERISIERRDAQLIEYPDTHHWFDAPLARKTVKLPQAPTIRRCKLMESEDGETINQEPKRRFAGPIHVSKEA
jgi:dienelactone hydrolase